MSKNLVLLENCTQVTAKEGSLQTLANHLNLVLLLSEVLLIDQ